MSACDLCDDNGRCGHTALALTGISHDKFDGCLTAALGTRHSLTSPSRSCGSQGQEQWLAVGGAVARRGQELWLAVAGAVARRGQEQWLAGGQEQWLAVAGAVARRGRSSGSRRLEQWLPCPWS